MSARKAIPKKVRFDLFKRDGFKCQYCGATPPDVILEIDHIDPVANGGDNDPDNLTTACGPCNRGKGASLLTICPQSLADKASEVAEREAQLAGYQATLQAKRDRIEADVWSVFYRWRGQERTTHQRFQSVKRFVESLGLDEVIDAVDTTLAAEVCSDGREFKYFCAVCWNKVRANG